MEFTVSRSELVRELNLAQGVVEKKATIPILSNVLLEATGERVVLTATDLELGIRCSFPARVETEGAGTVPGRKLLEYVRLLPDVDIHVKFLQNEWASLVCGRSRTRIAGMSRENFPELPEMPDSVAEIAVGDLLALIERTCFAISSEESRFSLNGGLLVLRDGAAAMVATDGHRLAFAQTRNPSESITGFHKALVPRKALAEIQKLANESQSDLHVHFASNENHLFFRFGDRLLISRRLTGNFPDYERVLPKDHPYSLTLNREEVKGAIERVAQFSDERSRAIKFQIAPGELKIHSSLSETGESEESVSTVYEGPSLEIGFNADYLLHFLRAISDDEVCLYFRDSQSAGEWRPAGDGGAFEYRYIVMPMRI